MSTRQPSESPKGVVVPLAPVGNGESLPPLPAPLTSLIGRAGETAALSDLICRPDVRLVTPMGPGGVGKTRLALSVAEATKDRFPDGVAFISLAPITDPELVLTVLAAHLNVRDAGIEPLLDRLARFLRPKHLLLVLDNCEHLLKAAPTIAALLSGCQSLSVVATSRIALRIAGEHRFNVPTLAVPAIQSGQPQWLDRIGEGGAVELFEARARAISPDFALTDINAAAVVEVCRRLDGLPLAIELAAACTSIQSLEGMLRRMGDKLALLNKGSVDSPPRQQTLRSTVDWSHALLDDAEKRLFSRLSVFVRGFKLEAAEAVAGQRAITDDRQRSQDTEEKLLALASRQLAPRSPTVLDGIATLIDHSLLQRAVNDRFTMLETIREYAQDRLAEEGAATEARQQHAAHFLTLAERAEAAWDGPEQAFSLNQLEEEQDNLRSALGWFHERSEVEPLLRLAASLRLYWTVRGSQREGRQWLEIALAYREGPTA